MDPRERPEFDVLDGVLRVKYSMRIDYSWAAVMHRGACLGGDKRHVVGDCDFFACICAFSDYYQHVLYSKYAMHHTESRTEYIEDEKVSVFPINLNANTNWGKQ